MRAAHPKRGLLPSGLKVLLFGLVLGSLIVLQCEVYQFMKPARTTLCCDTPQDLGFAYEEIAFTGPGDVRLSGWYIPSRNRAAVILLHDTGQNRLAVMAQADALAEAGFGVLMYDRRAYGASGGERRSWGWGDVKDVPAAVATLLEQGDLDPQKIGILGIGSGAEVALAAAVEVDAIRAVVAESPGFFVPEDLPPPESFQERLLRLPKQAVQLLLSWETGEPIPRPLSDQIDEIAPRPILLISPQDGTEARQTAHYYSLAGMPKELWTLPPQDASEPQNVLSEEYQARVVRFFREALLNGLEREDV